jgi:NADH dehydrogenase
MAFFFSWLVGRLVNDVVLTPDEVGGLMANLLISREAPMGQTRLSEWLAQNADRVGARYASELKQHYR